ncbi:Rrf2 family transcriptional regulator [Streptomyces sp. NBC_01187]|nr:Rrf2 family transcriptional regulator [Streptomyces sp. NBC_01187]
MQISAKADYAVRSLVELAADSARPLTCESIASSQDIPFRFLKSVFRDLRREGLVRSQRGCEGGYWIARDPAAITVAEVMTAVDGELFTVRGERPDRLRHPGAAQGVADLWHHLATTAEARLRATTIADLASHPRPAQPRPAQSGAAPAGAAPAGAAPVGAVPVTEPRDVEPHVGRQVPESAASV